jgi:hypothetical protein
MKHGTAPTSAELSNIDTRLGPLEKKCEKLIITDEVTPPSNEVLPPSNEVLPPECIHLILGLFDWRLAVRLRGKLGKGYKDFTSHPAFVQSRPEAEGEYSPISFMVDAKDDLLWVGLNTKTRKWESLPSLNFAKDTVLPSPDPDLFKDYLVAGDGGLVCFNVGKSAGRESIVVCNPLTRQVKLLPPLKYPRHPVLMHFRIVDDIGNYKIVVAGSAATGTEDVSLKTEEYDSRTGLWECPEGSDLPCQPFGLNEYQNGVQIGDLLLCGAIIDTRGRGILIYDLKKKTWLQDHRKLHIPLVRTSESNMGHLATSQLVECGGSVYVFSEQECGREVYFLIHKLNLDGLESNPWEEIMRRKRVGGRGLLVYPEYTCIAVSEHELAIFNTVEHTIEIVDLNNPSEVASLRSAPSHKANRFHSLNPIGFPYRPSFGSLVCPRGRHPNSRCIFDLKQGQYCSECERRNSDSGLITVRSSPVTVANDGPIAEIPLVIAEPSPMLEDDKSRFKTRRRRQKKGMRNSPSVNAPLDCFT